MPDWVALGRSAGGVRAVLLRDAQVLKDADGENEARVLATFGAEATPLVRLGDGAPSRLPTALMPGDRARVPALEQASPPDIIDAWARLHLLGLTVALPSWDGVVCLQSGDVSHWVHLSTGEAVSTQSFLTPRLINALGGAATAATDAINDSLSRPERLAAYLRRADVTAQPSATTGHLIGAELAASKPYWLGQDVALIARPDSAYAIALDSQSVPHRLHDPDTLLAAGLGALAP